MKDSNRSGGLTLAATAALSFGLASAPGIAVGQAAADSGGLEEVVVTARKREENLVDVPLSISAFSEAFIEKTGMDNVVDLANQTPGLSFRPAFGRVGTGQGGGSSNRPTLRGQANITGTPNVGFFVDGVYVSGNIVSYQLDNLERIEVIRGGQAALFGRGTFAGAVNFVTREPGDTVRGKVELTGGSFEQQEASGWVSGPLIGDRLYGEFNARYYDRGGDWLNRATGLKDGGVEGTRSAGGKLLWKATDALTVTWTAGWAEDEDDGTFPARYTGVNCLLPNIVGTQAVTGLPISSNRRRGYFCGEAEVADSFYARLDLLRAFGLKGVDRVNVRSSLSVDYDFANDWSVTAVGAFNRFRNRQAFDSTFEDGEANQRPAGLNATEDRRIDRSIELRIDSPREARVHGLLGFYFYEEEDDPGYRYTFALPMAPAPVPIGASNLVTATRIATNRMTKCRTGRPSRSSTSTSRSA
jgi:iron complex outermembrane recepter protein